MFFCQGVCSQMLDNRYGTAFTDKPFFNQEFIRDNKLKTLKGQFTYKKPGEVMRTTEFNYVYTFDSLGRLNSSFETRNDDGTVDTTWNVYLYTEDNQLKEHKRGDGKGFTSTIYEFDDQNNTIRESYIREYLDTLGILQKTTLNSETMMYEKFDHQLKKTVYNSYDLPYLNEFRYYSELGYLTEKEERLMMTFGVSTTKYEYNEKGFISAIKTYQYGIETPTEETIFTYDENGNLLEKHYYRNGVFITELELIYNSKSKLLTYVITRDIATNFIMILGFKDYEFY